jgi:hypothetical protein
MPRVGPLRGIQPNNSPRSHVTFSSVALERDLLAQSPHSCMAGSSSNRVFD